MPLHVRSSSSSVLRLWNEVVCHPQHGLLNTTHQRRVLAFRLFQFIFRSHETIATIDRASLLHNPLFVKSLAAHICQTDSHLHRPAMRIVSCIKGNCSPVPKWYSSVLIGTRRNGI